MKRLIRSNCACPACGSSDAAAYWKQEDGSVDGHCFSCSSYLSGEGIGHYEYSGPTFQQPGITLGDVLQLECRELSERYISKETATFYGVRGNDPSEVGEKARYYPIYKKGGLSGFKKRTLPKSFKGGRVGDSAGAINLFGQHLFKPGSIIIVTAGEEDAMASYEITKTILKSTEGIPSVSLPNGCHKRSILDNIEWLSGFKTIVFAVDQEEDKDLAKAKEFCALFPNCLTRIARFSEKDASAMCVAGKFTEYFYSLYNIT